MELKVTNQEKYQQLKSILKENDKDLDQIINQYIDKLYCTVQERIQEKRNQIDQQFNKKQDKYLINRFIKQRLKFDYFINKSGIVVCQQKNKIRQLNYTYNVQTGEIFIYLLKQNCPNKVTIQVLQNYSKKVSLKYLYEVIYGKDTFDKYAKDTVFQKVKLSQIAWKQKHGYRR